MSIVFFEVQGVVHFYGKDKLSAGPEQDTRDALATLQPWLGSV